MTQQSTPKGRILLVDHDEEWLSSARSVLEALGYEIETSKSIAEALALPDVYDLMLMNWIQADQERLLLHRLARPESPASAPCVVVMFPIQKLPQRMRAVFKAGAYDCVDKPFSKDDLITLVKALQEECILPKS
jgi:DNA-binding response OmpR family regulator